MLTWSARRKVIYLITFLGVIFVSLLSLFILLRENPTCFDGKKNQNEIAIDCGGGCEKVCKDEASDLVVHLSRVFKIDDGIYDAVAFVENPNFALGLKKLTYRFKVYDPSNSLVIEKSGVTYANPHEKFFIFLPRLDTGKRIPSRAFIEFDDPAWIRTNARESLEGVVIENKKLELIPSPRLAADIVNRTSRDIKEISLSAMLSDDDGNVIGYSGSSIARLLKGERRSVAFTWPHEFLKTPTVHEITFRAYLLK